MKSSTKHALAALQAQTKAMVVKLEELLDSEQQHLEDLDPESDKYGDSEEIVAHLEDAVSAAENLLEIFELTD